MKQWPLKILLVHPKAPFMQEKGFIVAADCALLINKDLVNRFGDETIIIGCPMLEDPKRVFEKLRMIIEESNAEKIEVFTMEVPCCHAIHIMLDKAKEESGKNVEIEKYIVRVNGDVERYSGKIDRDMLNAEIKAHSGGCKFHE